MGNLPAPTPDSDDPSLHALSLPGTQLRCSPLAWSGSVLVPFFSPHREFKFPMML